MSCFVVVVELQETHNNWPRYYAELADTPWELAVVVAFRVSISINSPSINRPRLSGRGAKLYFN